MVFVDSDKFSASDLALFVESLEEISRIESLRKQRKQKYRAQSQLNQQTNTESSSTSNEKPEEAASVIQNFEGNHIGSLMENQYYLDADHNNKQQDDTLSCHSEFYSTPYDCSLSTKLDDYETLNFSNQENQMGCNTTCLMENQHYFVNHAAHHNNKEQEDSLACNSVLYSMPYDCLDSTKLDNSEYETVNLSNHQYEEVPQMIERPKAKRKLSFLGMVCKKYKKCFSNNNGSGSYWHKSDSWTKIPVD